MNHAKHNKVGRIEYIGELGLLTKSSTTLFSKVTFTGHLLHCVCNAEDEYHAMFEEDTHYLGQGRTNNWKNLPRNKNKALRCSANRLSGWFKTISTLMRLEFGSKRTTPFSGQNHLVYCSWLLGCSEAGVCQPISHDLIWLTGSGHFVYIWIGIKTLFYLYNLNCDIWEQISISNELRSI
jgi:hypothetical protein